MPMLIQEALNKDQDFSVSSLVTSHTGDHIAKVDDVEYLS
jgi:hypothetical protein